MKLPLRSSPPRHEIFVEMRLPSKELNDLNGGKKNNMITKRNSLDATVSTMDMSCSGEFTTTSSSDVDAAGIVRFDLEATVYIPIPALADMAEDERHAAWFTRENYDIIMGANNITAKLMRIGRENPEAFGHCFRGLENRLTECRRERDERTRNASRVVLEEQRLQKEACMTDSKSLAKLYHLATLPSLEIALSRAETDSQAAASYQEEHASSTPPPPILPPRRQLSKPTPASEPIPAFQINSSSKSAADFKVKICEDDEVSILSDEASTPDIMYASEGRGFVRRFRHFIQKQQRPSGGSRAPSVSGSSQRQQCRR